MAGRSRGQLPEVFGQRLAAPGREQRDELPHVLAADPAPRPVAHHAPLALGRRCQPVGLHEAVEDRVVGGGPRPRLARLEGQVAQPGAAGYDQVGRRHASAWYDRSTRPDNHTDRLDFSVDGPQGVVRREW